MLVQGLLIIVSAVFAYSVAVAGRYVLTHHAERQGEESQLVYLSFILMAVIRICLAPVAKGYTPDVGLFQAWAVQAARDLGGFYSGEVFSDYPPGYVYILFLVGKLKGLLRVADGSPAFLALIKLPAIMADMAAAFLIYRLAYGLRGRRCALSLALVYGLNPAIIINSAVWGQVDAVFTFFVAVSAFCLTRGFLIRAVLAFTLAVLLKPQALIFTPLLLGVALDRLIREFNATTVKMVLLSVAAGLALFIAGIYPFALEEGPLWIFTHYHSTLTSYPYATLNAFNLFALSGGNFAPETGSWLFFSYKTWGIFFVVAATLFSLAVYFRGKEEQRLFYMGCFLMAAVFTLSSRMHERYLFPLLIFALLASLYSGDLKMLVIFAGYSTTHFINVALVLIDSTHGVYQVSRFDPLLIGTSVANLFLLGYTVWYGAVTWLSRARQPSPDTLGTAP